MDLSQLAQGALSTIAADPFQVVKDLFSVVGAFATVYTLVTKLQDRRTEVTVKISNGFLTGAPGELSDAMLLLEAVNTGGRPVVLASSLFRLPDRRQLISFKQSGEARLPHELKPGRSCTFWMPIGEAAGSLRRSGYHGTVQLIGEFRDQTGRVFTGGSYELNLDSWLG